MEEIINEKLWGIWLSKKGWLIGNNNEAIVFPSEETAIIFAKWFKGQVLPIDQSLIDLQEKLLEAEEERLLEIEKLETEKEIENKKLLDAEKSRNKWHTLSNLLRKPK